MKCLLPLLILINCRSIEGVLEWTVFGKVTEYGQNVTLFCNVSNCCPNYAGWDRWTPVQQTLFIDVKTGQANAKYDGKALQNGYTLVIQNLSKTDLNVSYSCVYGAIFGKRKFLLEEDVFYFISTRQPNINIGLSEGSIAFIMTGTTTVMVVVAVSIYCWKKRNKSQERNTNLDCTQQLLDTNVQDAQRESIPMNIRDQITNTITDWRKKDEMFVSTGASDYVSECLQKISCVTLTGPSGVGKSFICRHIALDLEKKGYFIIPVEVPTDIKTYYQPGKHTVFIVDDICGNFTASQQQIDIWKQLLPVIDRIIADKCCKIIASCRLQVYKDEKFDILSSFKSCECNLVSNKLGLTSAEKTVVAKTYIGTNFEYIDDVSQSCDFFPLLCSLYNKQKYVNVKEYFKNPFDVYKSELDILCEHGDDGNYKICSLALCVFFNNLLEEKWFEGKVTDAQRHIIEDTCGACDINRGTSKARLKKALDTLDGTFIYKHNGVYRTVHDQLFDFLAHYFGKKMIECLIEHGDSYLVHERLIWQKSPDDKTGNIDFIIEIPDDHLESYLKRFIKDWLAGKVAVVFSNNNMTESSFRQKLLQLLEQLDKPMQVILANTKDTVLPHIDNCGSGNTPLIYTCYNSYTDMVHWLLRNDVEVNRCRDDGVSGLLVASERGNTDIVKLLLEKYSNVNICDNDGRSPLLQASQEGHTDIVKLLLERNSDVNLCDKDGCSPLIQASQKGHTEIVRLLLEKDPHSFDNTFPSTSYVNNDTNISNSPYLVQPLMKKKPDIDAQTYEGGNALYFSVQNGNIEITQLLLDNNADCNICIYSKQQITEILKKHPTQTLDKLKRHIFDTLLKSTPPRVTEYVSANSVEYAFDVVAGSSPLHIASFIGRTDEVSFLLDHNDNINIRKEDGTTPLFYACEVGHEDIVRLLLDKGADKQICRQSDKTPLDIARENGHTSIVVIVKEHTKRENTRLQQLLLYV